MNLIWITAALAFVLGFALGVLSTIAFADRLNKDIERLPKS